MNEAARDWRGFVLQYGWRAHGHELAAALGRTVEEVETVRRSTRACARLLKLKRFPELFALWHGRPPGNDEWPMPRRLPRKGTYEWQGPELELLASLVGRVGKGQAARILSRRLQKLTGDRRARRSANSVQMAMSNRLGLQVGDVVGGITATTAGKEIGSYAMVFQAIQRKHLRAFKVGRTIVIPHDAWKKWKATRVFPPPGFVRLSTLKGPLGIRSDNLSEWARMGHVPTAVRCNPYGERMKSTQFGTWYIDPKVAEQLIVDRRAGNPMPWWGKPELGNLKVTYKLLEKRKHPPACVTCRRIWGSKGAPRSFSEYVVRYHPLAHGAKRHLTRQWSPGLTMQQVADLTGRSWGGVRLAVENGMLVAQRIGRTRYISRTEVSLWRERKCPTGGADKSWLSLSAASMQYGFTEEELRRYIKRHTLHSKVGTDGAARGIVYVGRHQVGKLRQRIGFTEEEAASRAGIRVERFRELVKEVDWRGAKGIPLDTVNAVIKRLKSRQGITTAEAASALEVTEDWIYERVRDGTIRMLRARWDRRRLYITPSMLERLRLAKKKPVKPEEFNSEWLFLSQAAKEAGVSSSMVNIWAAAGDLNRRQSHIGWRYHRASVRARARRYWISPRLKRPVPPAWLQEERKSKGGNDGTDHLPGVEQAAAAAARHGQLHHAARLQ